MAAIARVTAKDRDGIDPAIYAELGEALFWLCALAEVNGRKARPIVKGLRWAPNRIAHGIVVSAPVGWHYGAELGRLVLDRAVLGTTSGHEWLDRSQVVEVRTAHADQPLAAAYDAEIRRESARSLPVTC